jgi:hypothetical protein
MVALLCPDRYSPYRLEGTFSQTQAVGSTHLPLHFMTTMLAAVLAYNPLLFYLIRSPSRPRSPQPR